MPKPKMADRSAVAEKSLTIRISRKTRALLDALVEKSDAEVRPKGGHTTVGSYITSLIENAAKASGVSVTLPAEEETAPTPKKKVR